jgi:acetyl-CoA C-acetyltransferase
VPATTVNVQCGSAQQATTLAHGLVGSGLIDVAVACGVENMSMVPMGSSIPRDPDVGAPRAGRYAEVYEPTTQLEGSDRIAAKWGIGRDELDAFSCGRSNSQHRHGPRIASQVRSRRSGHRARRRGRPSRTTYFDRDEGVARHQHRVMAPRTNRQADDAPTRQARRRRSPTVPRLCC